MNKLLGYSLLGSGLLGVIFFLTYKGTVIPVKELWFVISIFMLATGAYLLARHKFQQHQTQHGSVINDRLAEIDRLRRTGEQIEITLENAEVTSSRFQQEHAGSEFPSRMEMLDSFVDGNDKTESIQQTYIVYQKVIGGKKYKYLSPVTTQSVEAVKRYIDRQMGVTLYIDKVNPSNYHFDLPYV